MNSNDMSFFTINNIFTNLQEISKYHDLRYFHILRDRFKKNILVFHIL